MSHTPRLLPLLSAIAVITLAFGGGVWMSIHQAARTDGTQVEGLLWPDPPSLPSFHLMDHQERPFTLEQLRGRWSMIFFGFTHCPDVCPTTLQTLADADRQLRSNPDYAQHGQIVFVSVDPERDNPNLLKDYVSYFSPEFLGVTGGQEELKLLARALGVLFMKVEQAGTEYTMDHSAGIFFVSPRGRLVSVMTPPHSSAAVVGRFQAISRFIADQS